MMVVGVNSKQRKIKDSFPVSWWPDLSSYLFNSKVLILIELVENRYVKIFKRCTILIYWKVLVPQGHMEQDLF